MGTIHLGAAVIVLFLPLDMMISIPLATTAIVTGIYGVRRYALLQTSESVISAIQDPQGEWKIELRNGEACEAQLQGDSYIAHWLVVLNFRCGQGSSYSLILWPGMLEEEIFRQLRVRLKIFKKD